MQAGLFAGHPARHDTDGTIARINALARATRPNGLVVFIQHADFADGLARGSDVWALLPMLDRAPTDIVPGIN